MTDEQFTQIIASMQDITIMLGVIAFLISFFFITKVLLSWWRR